MELNIQVDEKQLHDLETLLSHVKNGVPKVLSAAANDTARSQRTAISRRIRDKVNIKKADIDKSLKIKKARYAYPSAMVKISETARLSLKYFGAKQTKTGVNYKIEKKGKRQSIKRAFISDKIGGHVFMRAVESRFKNAVKKAFRIAWNRNAKDPAAGKRKKGPPFLVGRLKIHKKFGPSPWGVFVMSGMEKQVLPDATAMMAKNVERKLAWLLEKNPRATQEDATTTSN